MLALTGAGISTDSGIPDYRGPGSPNRTPMTYGEFVSGADSQRRYWARSHIGWSRMGHASPNAGHHALARLEASGRVPMLITQNVDGLHEAAGSRRLCALHGRVADVDLPVLSAPHRASSPGPAARRAQPRLGAAARPRRCPTRR